MRLGTGKNITILPTVCPISDSKITSKYLTYSIMAVQSFAYYSKVNGVQEEIGPLSWRKHKDSDS